jgi:hypothetical protein
LRRLQSLVARARATERSRWWTTFLLVAALCSLWSLSTPLFGAPDEPAHAIRAASVSRLQLVGDEDPRFEDHLVVEAPRSFRVAGGEVSCYAFMRNVSASCADFPDDTSVGGVPTSAGRHPPAYYAFAGIPSLVFENALGVYLMRVVSALLTAAFVASSLLTIERLRSPRIGALAILVCVTPMLLFVGGVVNPSAAEIPAALCLWVAGLVLVSGATTAIDDRVLRRVGLAAIVLVLSRQLAPLWLGLIALALLAIGGTAAVRALWQHRGARRWGIAIVVATLLQLLWIAVVRPLDPSLGDSEAVRGLTTGTSLRMSTGETLNRLREMVGWFGWLDSPSPGVTYVLWTLAFAVVVVIGVLLARKRLLLVAGAVALVSIAAPIAFETVQARNIGFFWQGRYSMPLAIGVPVLLAVGAALGDRDGRRPGDRRDDDRAMRERLAVLVPGVAVAVAIAHVLAYGQTLRRNTVGYDGPLDFVIDPIWSPPLPSALLMVAFVVVIGAFVTWVATSDRATPTVAPATPDYERASPSGSQRYS